jgi:thioredoxin 1
MGHRATITHEVNDAQIHVGHRAEDVPVRGIFGRVDDHVGARLRRDPSNGLLLCVACRLERAESVTKGGPSTQQFREPSTSWKWGIRWSTSAHPGPLHPLVGLLAERGKIQPPREVEYRLDRDVVQEWRTRHFDRFNSGSTGGISVADMQAVGEIDFNEAVLGSDTPVIVDFWAEWCGPCRLVHPELEKIQVEYEGKIKVVRLNIDESPSVAARYGVMSIPTIALFQDGKLAAQVVGARPKEQIVTGLGLAG